ncbi:hypothetical protein APSETT444_005991 [Aspergillus pseudonomiae]
MDRNSTTEALSLWEILHPILINLDMRTLLHAQRVCRLWHHIISKSRSLQQALFFLPVEERQATTSDERRSQINPLLREILWPQLSWLATCGRELKSSERKRQAKTRRIPILRSENASWRRMLIRQPPPITIGIMGEDENHSPAPIIYYDEDISTDALWALTNISFFADHCFTRCIFSGDDTWKESYPQDADPISDRELEKFWTYHLDDKDQDGASTLDGDMYRTQLNPLTEEEATVVKQIVNHESLPGGVIPPANYLNPFLRVMAKLFEKGILPKVVFEEHRIIYGVR